MTRPTLTQSSGPAFSRIFGLGGVRGERVVPNDDLVGPIDSSDEWIRQRTGIVTRRRAESGTDVLDLAEQAARAAIENAGLTGADIDAVILSTVTYFHQTPAGAAIVADRIGANPAAAYDISAACAGYCYGIGQADALVRSGAARHVLVIGAEKMSEFVDPTDRSISFLLGDGAGAVVIGPSDFPGIGPTVWGSDGSQAQTIRQTHSWLATRDEGYVGEIVDAARRITAPLDLIVSGHTHSEVRAEVNGIPIVQARSSGTALGVVTLTFDRGQDAVVGHSIDVWTTRHEGVAPDPDIVALVEQVTAGVDMAAAQKLAAKVKSGEGFDLEDFLEQLRQMKQMGGLSTLLEKMPAQVQAKAGQVDMDKAERDIRRKEGIICSMTAAERRKPEIIKATRKRRIAAGAGVQVQEVNRLLNEFEQMQGMMKKMKGGGLMKLMKKMGGMKGGLPGMGGMPRF